MKKYDQLMIAGLAAASSVGTMQATGSIAAGVAVITGLFCVVTAIRAVIEKE